MGCLAQDEKFLAPYEAGEDLYEPVMRAAGIDRDTSKVVVLASMYGQGLSSMARRIDASPEQAAQIRRQMLATMPRCAKWMSRVQEIGGQHGKVVTAAGRILAVPI